MTKWLTCNLTIYVTMVICLGLWSGHVSQTLSMDLSQEGFRFHRKQLKNGQGQLVPDTDRSALLEEDGADMDSLKEDSEDEELHDSDLDEGIYMPAVRPVSEHQFRMKMKSAQTYHDVLRIFLGESLTDFDIDQIMTTHRYIKQPLSVPGSTRTSIRKLPTKEGTYNNPNQRIQSNALVPFHDTTRNLHLHKGLTKSDSEDVMLGDSPICEVCFHIPWAHKPVSRESRHLSQKRHQNMKRHSKSRYKQKKRHKRSKKCKTRRQEIANKIKKCKRKDNFKYCAKLRKRYKDHVRKCRSDKKNDSDIPKETVTLPPHRPVQTTTANPRDSTTAVPEQNEKYPKDWKQWEKTKNETTEHAQCEEPVKEILRVRDITNKGDEIYYPECLVHYVCNVTSGCCGPRQQCGPDPDHIQEDVRAVMVMQFTGGTTDEMPDIHYLPVTNHMKCKCVDIPDSTWRPCPYPFNHSLHECRCVSSSHKDYCERIRRGKETLLSSDIECIVSGDCRPLDNSVCHFGPFDLEKRRCPTREESVDTGSGSVERKDTVKKRP